jgi:hypothetical protein
MGRLAEGGRLDHVQARARNFLVSYVGSPGDEGIRLEYYRVTAEHKIERPAGTWLIWCWMAMCAILLAVMYHTQAPLVTLDCLHDVQNKQAKATPENCASLTVLFLRSWHDLIVGTGSFIDRNRDDITAISALVVAIFTGTLWWVTWGMVRIAKDQRTDALRSIKAAETAALAAEKSAMVAETSLRHLERPYIFVRHLDLNPSLHPHGDTPHSHFHLGLTNFGRTPAIMSKIAISFRFICDDEGVLASDSHRQPMPNVIAVGETFSGIKFGIGKVTAEIYNGTRLGNIKLFVKIEIWYNDVFKSPIRHDIFSYTFVPDVNLFFARGGCG